MELTLDQLRYPIGKFISPENYTVDTINGYINTIENFPQALKKALHGLNDAQLDTPYREGGWTLRQVVHHLADSHINSYMRFKLAVTEDNPTIKTYNEKKWAELEEAKYASVQISLSLVEALHKRWTMFLKTLSPDNFKKTFHHPDSKRDVSLNQTVALYAWHCNHHLAHITELKKRMGW